MSFISKGNSEKLHFHCTGCGECCRNMLIDLTFAEAKDWAKDGGKVLLTTSFILGSDSPSKDVLQKFADARTLTARCGRQSIQVKLSLTGDVNGDCHNLKDNQCQIYDKRPLVCRSYPALAGEMLDFTKITPEQSACTADSWSGELIQIGSTLKHTGMRNAVIEFQEQQEADIDILHHLTDIMNIHVTTFDMTGHLFYVLDPKTAPALLDQAEQHFWAQGKASSIEWKVLTVKRGELEMFKQLGFTTADITQDMPRAIDVRCMLQGRSGMFDLKSH